MVDSNNMGDSIHIPSYMIAKNTGQKIRETVENEDNVMVRVMLDIANDDNIVEIDLWYSNPADFKYQEFH